MDESTKELIELAVTLFGWLPEHMKFRALLAVVVLFGGAFLLGAAKKWILVPLKLLPDPNAGRVQWLVYHVLTLTDFALGNSQLFKELVKELQRTKAKRSLPPPPPNALSGNNFKSMKFGSGSGPALIALCLVLSSCAGNQGARLAVGVNSLAAESLTELAVKLRDMQERDEDKALAAGTTEAERVEGLRLVRERYRPSRGAVDTAIEAQWALADAEVAALKLGTATPAEQALALAQAWRSMAPLLDKLGVRVPEPPAAISALMGGGL